MRILVTGAAGFIGSNVARTLLSRGDDVVGVDSLTDYYDPAIKRRNIDGLLGDGFEFLERDVSSIEPDTLDAAQVDAIVHLAGQPGVRKSWGTDFTAYTRGNVEATQSILEATLRSGRRPRFVYASSSSVYGQAETYPTTESTVPQPFSPYGVTKLAGEHLVRLYRDNFGLTTVAFRFFTVYGPGQRPDMAFTRFLSAADRGEAITIFGDGEQIRDFTYVDDIAAALVAAVYATDMLPPVMNLSGGSSVSVNEVLATIRELVGGSLTVRYEDAVKGDVFRTGGDSSLARTALGWRPRTELAEGLARQLEWVRQA